LQQIARDEVVDDSVVQGLRSADRIAVTTISSALATWRAGAPLRRWRRDQTQSHFRLAKEPKPQPPDNGRQWLLQPPPSAFPWMAQTTGLGNLKSQHERIEPDLRLFLPEVICWNSLISAPAMKVRPIRSDDRISGRIGGCFADRRTTPSGTPSSAH
jgi:hypothetical protein